MTDVTQTPVEIHGSPWESTLRQSGRNLLCALATGYILFVFSERIFWTAWLPNDSLVERIVMWLLYYVLTGPTGFLLLILSILVSIRWSQARKTDA